MRGNRLSRSFALPIRISADFSYPQNLFIQLWPYPVEFCEEKEVDEPEQLVSRGNISMLPLPRTTSLGHRSLGGFTLIEILAVIVVLAILAALLVPALRGMISRANEAKCVSNLKSISAASALYSADHNGNWPLNSVDSNDRHIFSNYLIPYLDAIPSQQDGNLMNSPLICPATLKEDVYIVGSYGLGYAQNGYAQNTDKAHYVKTRLAVDKVSSFMLYMDFTGHYLTSSATFNRSQEILAKRHTGKLNIAYADGSVSPMPLEDVPPQNPKTVEPASSFWYGRNGIK